MEPASSSPDLKSRIEDHALTAVPTSERRSGWGLMTNTAGIASTLVQLAIGGGVTLIAGVGYGILAGVVVAVFGGIVGWMVGQIAYVSGTSSTVTSRYYGLGVRGSALASLIFAFMILGFLALENALLYYGTLFMFGWKPSLGNAVLIYGVLTVVWIVLTTFGLKLVQRTSTVLLVAFTVLTVVLAVLALRGSGSSVGELLSAGPVVPGYGGGAHRFAVALSILAGSAGALALVDADYARYARSSRDVGILAVGGALMIDVVVVVLGTIVIHAGAVTVQNYLRDHPGVAATQGGDTTADKVLWMADNNSGAFFIVLAGFIGFALMYAAQIKAQVLNSYSGSLALSNLSNSLSGRHVGRFAMIVVGNLIGLLMIAGNILGLIAGYLGILGITTTALAGVMIADYFIVRRCRPAAQDRVEAVNWSGVSSLVVASAAGELVVTLDWTQLGFLVALVVALILYPLLRLTALPERGSAIDPAAALAES
ncbi:purine-cytosine permease family protein [Nocardia sp. NPDC101769]|uniref:purine-cytosine permease family protein n=1 Tax=Nocardia sp. NPDC101769 TaxID=3364333 RepID=UPI00382EF4BF